MTEPGGPGRIDRISAEDATSLATDVGPAPAQIGAILWLDTPDGFDIDTGIEAIAERTGAIPRLRQRLQRLPIGCGRPIWVDDEHFDIRRHVAVAVPPLEADHEDVHALAAALVATRLPDDHPLWSATFIPAIRTGETALVVVFHHVLADGIGGLAVLAGLVDGGPDVPPPAPPRPGPAPPELALDALRARGRALRSIGRVPSTIRASVEELRATGRTRASRSSLNRPTGPRRRLAVARVTLDPIKGVAHGSGGSVNDVVLAAVAGALHELLEHRGERVDRFVVSIPVSGRRAATATELGNHVGVAPIELPWIADRSTRLLTVAARGERVRSAPRGASAELLGPVFRTLARLGCFRWLVDRQRLVNSFVTNLRGPETSLTFLDSPITAVLPIAGIAGNVTVAFAVLSYAGTLAVTIIADPEACPDLEQLRAGLQGELDAYARLGARSASSP